MAHIKIKRLHQLGKSEARQRVEAIANSLQDKLNAQLSWQGDSLDFQHSGTSGTVAVGEDFVEFSIRLSLLLSPMKGPIEERIQQQIDSALG